jgi:hypothetical protein
MAADGVLPPARRRSGHGRLNRRPPTVACDLAVDRRLLGDQHATFSKSGPSSTTTTTAAVKLLMLIGRRHLVAVRKHHPPPARQTIAR